MRIVALVLAALLGPCAGWGGETAPPGPSRTPALAGFDPYVVWFETRQAGWAAGGEGDVTHVVRTTDGGATWSHAGTIPAHVERIRFEGESGWAFGAETYETSDGGATWHAVPRAGGRLLVAVGTFWEGSLHLRGTHDSVVSASDGHSDRVLDARGPTAAKDDLVAFWKGIAFRTADGRLRVSRDAGSTWATRTVCPDRLVDVAGTHAPEPALPRLEELYLLCDNALRHSPDGGATFATRSTAVGEYSEIAVGWPGQVVVAGADLATSPDGGRTFRTVPAPPGTVAWTGPRMVDGSFGTVVRVERSARELWVTDDGGRTWRASPIR